MVEQRAPGRRVAWHHTPEGSSTEPRDRIIEAAARSMTKLGVERTSISAIAREAGVSRPTIYSYFHNREEILREAVPRLAGEVISRIQAHAMNSATAADFIVEVVARSVEELMATPSIAPMIQRLDTADGRAQAMGPDIITLARGLMEPLLQYQPDLADNLEEITETQLRMMISLLTYPSPRTSTPELLRGYLRRVLVPSLGIRDD